MKACTQIYLLLSLVVTGAILSVPFLMFDFKQHPDNNVSCLPLPRSGTPSPEPLLSNDEGEGIVNDSKPTFKSAFAQNGNNFITYFKLPVTKDKTSVKLQVYNDPPTAPQQQEAQDFSKFGCEGNYNSSFNISSVFQDPEVRENVNLWLLVNGEAHLHNQIRLTRFSYANDWVQIACASIIFLTYIALWEKQSFHGWAQFCFISLELLQRIVNLTQTGAFHWDYVSILVHRWDLQYLTFCPLVDLFCYYVPIAQMFCLTAVIYDIWRTFGKDTLVTASETNRDEKIYLQFAFIGIMFPALYTSFGFFLHGLTDGYKCHPRFDEVLDVLLYLVYRYLPSIFLCILNLYLLRRTHVTLAKVRTECRVVRKQCSSTQINPMLRLKFYLELLLTLSILTLVIKPFSRLMMAFGLPLERYDGGYVNIVLYTLSRTHSCILLVVLMKHLPTSVRLEMKLQEFRNAFQHGKKKYCGDGDLTKKIMFWAFHVGFHAIRIATVHALLLLCLIVGCNCCSVSVLKRSRKILTNELTTSSSKMENSNNSITDSSII